MIINNRHYTKNEIQKYVGNISQLGGTRHYELSCGKAKGTRAVDINTGSGLKFTVLPDRGMDISLASYKGINLSYISAAGEVSPVYYNSFENEWLHSFYAGLLTTCGLTNISTPVTDQGERLGLHGRYSSIPALQFCDLSDWKDDEYIIKLTGIMKEAVLFGNKLKLKRTITSKLGGKKIHINDMIENIGSQKSPFTILYHINFGFPLLSEESSLYFSSDKVEPLEPLAKENIKSYNKFDKPDDNAAEQNFTHIMSCDNEGYAYAGIINKHIFDGLGLSIKFKTGTLPYLNQWKLNRSVDYVCALEPCNTYCRNRKILREMNMLPFIMPGEKKNMDIELEILDNKNDINEFEKK